MCNVGGDHKHNLSCKLYTSNMSRQELIDLIAKQGYRSEVSEEEGSGYVRVVTFEPLPAHVKNVIEASVPATVKLTFSVRDTTKLELPQSLKKWAQQAAKYVKK